MCVYPLVRLELIVGDLGGMRGVLGVLAVAFAVR